jgi:hypothetical protein
LRPPYLVASSRERAEGEAQRIVRSELALLQPAPGLHPVQATLESGSAAVPTIVPSEGIAFDGSAFVGTVATAPGFNYLRRIDAKNERLVELMGIEPMTS